MRHTLKRQARIGGEFVLRDRWTSGIVEASSGTHPFRFACARGLFDEPLSAGDEKGLCGDREQLTRDKH
jgi:hypothetical protein